MSKVLRFPKKDGFKRKIPAQGPFRFRRAEWETQTPAMVGLHQAARFEEHLEEALGDNRPVSFVPSHLPLKGGLGRTVRALYFYRDDTETMERVYLLAGMMELATRLSHQLLRTDLIHRLFVTIRSMSGELDLRWSTDRDGFLLPLPESLYPRTRLNRELRRAETFQELLKSLEAETQIQFTLCSRNFVFYLPRGWVILKPCY